MATNSFLTNVDIKDKDLAKSLVMALEEASRKHTHNIVLSKSYEDVKGDKLMGIIVK